MRSSRSPRLLWLIAAPLAIACGEDARPTEPTAAAPPRALAADRYRVTWAASARTQALSEGRAALERLECTRCHVIDDVEPAGRSEHCVSCHVFLKGLAPDERRYRTLASRYGEETIERYQRNIQHFRAVPDLTAIARRLRPEWIGEYVAEPFDLRPTMEESMVRIQVEENDVRAIVRYFAAVAEVADPYGGPSGARPPALERSDDRIARGRALFAQRGCNACHYVGNIRLGKTEAEIRAGGATAQQAPNLRFVRDRMHPDVVVDWITDPSRLAPGTLMPNLGVSAEDAALIRDFLFFADPELEPTPPAPNLALPAAVDRPVSWDEVKERVLGRVCVHCHMNDNERDLGPGNRGGWGWPARHLRFRTYEALISGMPLGERTVSVLEPSQESTSMPPILEAMLRRRDEERRDHVLPFHDHERPHYPDRNPGMPMGLPSMTDTEIGLLRAWIEQGCVGATNVTGMPGITDGFLVPDGPIEPNRGCAVRPPMDPRPAWASHPPPEWARDDHRAPSTNRP